MTDAADYIAFIKSIVVAHSAITNFKIVREEIQGEIGLYRYRLSLDDGGLLEIFERFEVVSEQVIVTKYSFQLQTDDGTLVKRWDNAPHHPEIATHPHHLHDGADENVVSHPPVTAPEIINLIGK